MGKQCRCEALWRALPALKIYNLCDFPRSEQRSGSAIPIHQNWLEIILFRHDLNTFIITHETMTIVSGIRQPDRS